MKKILALVLALCMVFALCACGAKTEAPAQAPAAEAPAAEAPAAEAPAAEKVRVGMVTDVGGVNDKSFNQTSWEGLQALDPAVFEVNYLESKTDADYQTNIQTFIDEEYDLIICVGFMLADATREAAEATFDETVGVKALDDYTLEYTLEAPFPAFLSMMGYGCFAPLNRAFYKAQGGTFSVDGDEYTSGNYGTSPANIAYCGAYLVKNFTEKNVTSYVANPSYWNAEAVNTPNINFYFNDGSDPLRTYNEAKDNTIAGCSFNSSALVLAKEEKPEGADKTYFDLYSYTTTNSATTYCGWVNMHRGTWANYNDNTVGVSTKSEEEKVRTRDALSNQNFRLALAMAFDRGAFNSTIVGEELKFASLKNSYVTGNFGKTAAEVTVDINGVATTFPAGTYFGVIEQAQLDADGVPLKVWDPTADGGVGSGDGFDGWYNPEVAKAELEIAIAELAEQGYEISAENPVRLDIASFTGNDSFKNQDQAMKQSVEAVLGGVVIVDIVPCETAMDWYNATYYPNTGDEMNFDIGNNGGWGPDYGDPKSYLDTMLPGANGMTKSFGLF